MNLVNTWERYTNINHGGGQNKKMASCILQMLCRSFYHTVRNMAGFRMEGIYFRR